MHDAQPRIQFLQGNEAVALGAIDAGVNFFAGYPITPATEIAEKLSVLLPLNGGNCLQMEDEIASLGAAIGASALGAKAMVATSGPGFSLMQENIGYASYSEIPCVIAVIQRAGPSTGVATLPGQGDVMQSRWGTHGDHPIVVIAPSTVEEMYSLTIKCCNVAEKYRVPTILLSDAIVGHMRERVILPNRESIIIENRKLPQCSPEEYDLPYRGDEDGVPALAALATGYRYCVTGSMHTERGLQTSSDYEAIGGLIERLHRKLELAEDDISLFESETVPRAQTLVLAYGCTARSARQAVQFANDNGRSINFFRPVTLWPFPRKAFSSVIKNIKAIVVPEMNRGQYSDVVRCELNRLGLCCRVVDFPQIDGQLPHPQEILRVIEEVDGNA